MAEEEREALVRKLEAERLTGMPRWRLLDLTRPRRTLEMLAREAFKRGRT